MTKPKYHSKSEMKRVKTLKQSKAKPLGDLLLEMEVIIDDMIDMHDLQWADVFALVKAQLEVHRPDAREEYISGGSPVFYYGPKEGLK